MVKKSISITGCLFLIPFLCWTYATEKSVEDLRVEFFKYKLEKIKKEKPNLTAKESKYYVDSLILNQVKVLEARKQGIDTSFVYLNRVAEYSRALADRRFSNKLKRAPGPRVAVDSIEFLQIRHLFQSIPQQASNGDIEKKRILFDSISSQVCQNPSRFQEYVKHYSEVKEPIWVCKRQQVIEFDRQVMHLEVGEVSTPFFTPAGIHLVQVIGKGLYPKKKKRASWQSLSFNDLGSFLSAVTKSHDFSYVYETPWERNLWEPASNQVLFVFNGREYTKSDFDYFSKHNLTSLNKRYAAFILKTVLDEQYVSLVEKDELYEYDLMEFKQKLLLEELTRRELEERIFRDSTGIEDFFELHRQDYRLPLPRYQGILVLCSNRKVAREVKKLLRQNPSDRWVALLKNQFGGIKNQLIRVEEGPFVIGSNACIDKKIFKQGKYKAPASHPRLVLNGEVEWNPSSYLEVEEQVLADYKAYLKKKWEEKLLVSWGRELNEEVLKTVNKH